VLRIRIRRIHIFLGLQDTDLLVRDTDPDPSITQAKKVSKKLIPTVLWLLYDFLSMKNDVNVPSLMSLTKTTGSGSATGFGSINQRYGSADPAPDPNQNFMDLQHCFTASINNQVQRRQEGFLSPKRGFYSYEKKFQIFSFRQEKWAFLDPGVGKKLR
jgi:hypothetical protein